MFVASPRSAKKRVFFGGCLKLDNTPSIASIITDDADDVVLAGDAKQWAKGEMQGNRNGEKPRCRKMQGQKGGTKRDRNANKGVFKEMKGAETAVKEVKGHARKLSGKTCKESEVQIIPRINRT